MGIGLPSPVAGGFHSHQMRIVFVLHVTREDASIDEDRTFRGCAFIIDVQRTTPICDGAVVNHRTNWRCDAFTHTPGKCGGAFAVEVALESVADGLVQQNTRPTRPQYDRHCSCGRVTGFQVHQGHAHRLARVIECTVIL